MNPSKRFWRHVTNLAILAALSLVPFYLYFQSGISFFTLHAISGLMALKYQIAKCFLSGEYPLWNPFMISGTPFHSGIGIFDPFLIVFKFFKNAGDGLIATAYFALVTAGWGMYFYLRKVWRLTFSASMFGAILYFTAPFFAATSHEQPFMAPPVFLPLVFLFYELHLKDKSWWKLFAAALMLSLTFFCGNLESFYFVFLYFLLIQSARIAIHCYYAKSIQPFLSELKSGILCVLFTFAFMAIDLLPTIEMIFYSGRNANNTIGQNMANGFIVTLLGLAVVWGADRLSYLPQNISKKAPWVIAIIIFAVFAFNISWSPVFAHSNRNIFYPNPKMIFINGEEAFYLLQTTLSVPQEVLKSWVPTRFVFYVQPPIYLFTFATLLLFALTAAFTHNRYLRFLSATAFFLPLFAYTSVPNLNHLFFRFDEIAYPRIMFIFFFLVAVITGHGFERLTQWRPDTEINKLRAPMKIILGCCAVILLFFAFWLSAKPNLSSLRDLILVFHAKLQVAANPLELTALDTTIGLETLRYFTHLNRWLFVFGASKYLSILSLICAILYKKRFFRFLFIVFVATDVLLGWNFYTFQKRDIQLITNVTPEIEFLRTLNPNDKIGTTDDPSIDLWNFYEHTRAADLRWNLPFFWNVKSIEGATLNLAPRLFKQFWELEQGNTFTPTVLNAPVSNVYNLMGMNYLFSIFPINHPNLELVAQGSRYLIYKNTAAMPRFYFSKLIYPVDELTVKQQIASPAWNPRENTLIEGDIPEDWRLSRSLDSGVNPTPANVVKESFNSLTVQTDSPNAEFLVTSEAFHPHWHAFVDNKPAEIVKTNFYFRGIFLSAGRHTIRFVYKPESFIWGSWISLFMVLCLFLSFLARVIPRKQFKALSTSRNDDKTL